MAFVTSPRSVRISALKIDIDLKQALQILAIDVQNGYANDSMAGSVCFDTATLAIATTTTKVKTTSAIHGVVNGAYTTVAATDNFFTLAGTVSANQFGVWVFSVDATGAAFATFSGSFATAAAVVFPSIPYTQQILGFVLVSAGGSPFIGNTTALTGGTVTTTYVNTPGIGSVPPAQYFGPK